MIQTLLGRKIHEVSASLAVNMKTEQGKQPKGAPPSPSFVSGIQPAGRRGGGQASGSSGALLLTWRRVWASSSSSEDYEVRDEALNDCLGAATATLFRPDNVISSCISNHYKHKAAEACQTVSERLPSWANERLHAVRKMPRLFVFLLFSLFGLLWTFHDTLQAEVKGAHERWYQEQDMFDGRSGWLPVACGGIASCTLARNALFRPTSRASGRGAFSLLR